MSPKTTSVLRLKKNSSHIYEGKDECSVEGAFPSENPRFGFLNHMIHSSFFCIWLAGDFRLSKGDVKRISFFHTKEGFVRLPLTHLATIFSVIFYLSVTSHGKEK